MKNYVKYIDKLYEDIIERRMFVSKYKQELMYHGTTNKFLKSILSNGLLPSTKEKVWDLDKNASFYKASLQSYGGTYFTNNLLTAISSGRNAVSKLGGDDIIIIIAQLQPRSSLPDEDNFYSMVDGALNYAVGEKGKYNPTELFYVLTYWDYINKTERFKELVNDFVDKFKSMSSNETDNFWPEKHNIPKLLFDKMEKLFRDAIIRKISYLKKYDLKSYSSRATDIEWDELDKYLEFDKNKAEQDYAQALNDVMNTLKSQVYKMNSDWNKTYRITEPVRFSGKNKIVAIIEMENYIYGDGDKKMIVWYGDIPPKFKADFDERLGYKYSIEYKWINK